MSATAIPTDHTIEATMKAIIIYDDFELATKANGILGHAMQHADKTAQWQVKPWRVNLLTLAGIADAALSEAVDAHLIVLALRQSESLPACLRGWLEQWVVRRQVQDAALALWDGENGGMHSASATPELARFAECHGLSFIGNDGNPVEGESARFLDGLHEREVTQTPTLMHILEQPVHGYHQHWGINE
jgi:hypothetical protein